jgi:hypothetical protein
MKYEKTGLGYGVETIIDENKYSINITIGLHSTDNIAPNFSVDIIVESDNSQTGYEVDEQRSKAIEDYLELINK